MSTANNNGVLFFGIGALQYRVIRIDRVDTKSAWVFAFIPLIVIGLLIKFEPTAQDVDVIDENSRELPLNNSPVID